MVSAASEDQSTAEGTVDSSFVSPGNSRTKRHLSSSPPDRASPSSCFKSSRQDNRWRRSNFGGFGRNVRITVCANQGGRKYMEDRVHIHCARDSEGLLDFIYVAVYDGHGGAEASIYAKKHLLETILEQRGFHSNSDEGMLEAIREGFLLTHDSMKKVVDKWPRTASGFTSTSGTTASVAFIRHGKLFTGHVGDSGIVVGLQDDSNEDGILGKQITVDHKPDSPREWKRIEESGGQVMCKAGVMRVVWTRPMRGHVGPVRRSTPQENIPFLAVARALGDLWSYNDQMEQYVVSPEPDLDAVTMTKKQKCMVLGSDGLWNVVKPQYCADIVNAHEWKELREQGRNQDDKSWLDRPCHSNHSRWLIRNALRGWGSLRADNISVITVIFDPPDQEVDDNSRCVLRSGPNLDIEQILTEIPDAMVRVTPYTTQVLKTSPVELVYAGAVDTPIGFHFSGVNSLSFSSTAVSYSGPGFTAYAKETVVKRQSVMSAPTQRGGSSTGANSKLASVANSDTESSDLEENVSEKEDKEKLEENKQKKRTFYCTKHGLTCEKVRRLNEAAGERDPQKLKDLLDKTKVKNRLDTSTVTPEQRKKQVATGQKPKYFCRKHGLSCAKVKRMNEEYLKKQAEGSSLDSEVTAIHSPPDEQKEASRPVKKVGPSPKKGVPVRKSAESERKARPIRTPASAKYRRVTRAGTHLSPTRSLPSMKLRSGQTKLKKTARRLSLPCRETNQVHDANETVHNSIQHSPKTTKWETGEVVSNGYSSIRSRLNSLRGDVRSSAHLFRVRKLRYCLRQQPTSATETELKSKARRTQRASLQQTRQSPRGESEKIRPQSAMSHSEAERKTGRKSATTESVGVVRSSSSAEERRKSLRSSFSTQSSGLTKQNAGKAVVKISASSRRLKRSPIHDLPQAIRPTDKRDAEWNRNICGTKRKLGFGSADELGVEATENGLLSEPNSKKSRFWTSLLNIFSASSSSTKN